MTLTLAALSVAIGFHFGPGLALMRTSHRRAVSDITRACMIAIRRTPLLVQLFLIYYSLGLIRFTHDTPALWRVDSEGSRCAVMALALDTAAYSSEILCDGLTSVPVGLFELAKPVARPA
ncbi:ABC transporter permease subunit [Puniceibacterium confluentis]|uniref:ABC transporter permease subunit n=1 Tax=Puniceibacterium confluentis TaxID=1958944 RepID=UPI001647E366|nr:ABC transporter permease subunit [Puniceibacterium confluentis]